MDIGKIHGNIYNYATAEISNLYLNKYIEFRSNYTTKQLCNFGGSTNACRLLILIVVFMITSANLNQVNAESKEDELTRKYIETDSAEPKVNVKRYLKNTKMKFKNMIHKLKSRLHKTTKFPYFINLKRMVRLEEEDNVSKTSPTLEPMDSVFGFTKRKKTSCNRTKRFFTNLGEEYKYQSGDENKNESNLGLMNVSKIHADSLLGKYAKLFSTTAEYAPAAKAGTKGRQLMTRSINVTGKAFIPLLEEIAGHLTGRDGVGAVKLKVNSANGLFNIVPAVRGETGHCAGNSDQTSEEESTASTGWTASDKIKALKEKAREYYGYLSFKVDQLLTDYITNNNCN